MVSVGVVNPMAVDPAVSAREKILQDFRKKLIEHKELESRLKESMCLREFNNLVPHSFCIQPARRVFGALLKASYY